VGSRCIPPLILDHDTDWKGVLSFVLWALYVESKNAYYQLNRGLGDRGASIKNERYNVVRVGYILYCVTCVRLVCKTCP
jgi:hypothetical protein